MRDILISIGVILLLVAIIITNAIYINILLGSLEAGLAEVTSVTGYKELYNKYMRNEWLLSLTVEDERLLRIEVGFVDCLGYADKGLADELHMEKSRLLSELGQLKRLSWFNIMAIV